MIGTCVVAWVIKKEQQTTNHQNKHQLKQETFFLNTQYYVLNKEYKRTLINYFFRKDRGTEAYWKASTRSQYFRQNRWICQYVFK